MNLLFCCEYYYPSVGGVQEVMRQIAERLVLRGHTVTVATTYLPNRKFNEWNGVRIEEFNVTGNVVNGYSGEVERYRKYILDFKGDAILIKAAQQWTFDTIWSELEEISVHKVFIPCGFSGLFVPRYAAYFKALPRILNLFNALIFYSNNYRDINFARKHKIENCIVLANGASEVEFSSPIDANFRKKHGISKESFLILTVGSLTGSKGHLELGQAFKLVKPNANSVTLLLNGNNPFNTTYKKEDAPNVRLRYALLNIFLKNFYHPIHCLKAIRNEINRRRNPVIKRRENEWIPPPQLIQECVNEINLLGDSNKKALLCDLSRDELIQAYFAADLFVFASQVEYSPLVLFEAAASSTPFLTSRVGNAEEIIEWLGGGFTYEDSKNQEGYSLTDPQVLADEINILMNQRSYLKKIGKQLNYSWKQKFTWDEIAKQYEKVLQGESVEHN